MEGGSADYAGGRATQEAKAESTEIMIDIDLYTIIASGTLDAVQKSNIRRSRVRDCTRNQHPSFLRSLSPRRRGAGIQ